MGTDADQCPGLLGRERGPPGGMQSRSTIEQAKGMLMAENGCGADEAFGILVRASQRQNRKLRDIAQALIDARSNGRGRT